MAAVAYCPDCRTALNLAEKPIRCPKCDVVFLRDELQLEQGRDVGEPHQDSRPVVDERDLRAFTPGQIGGSLIALFPLMLGVGFFVWLGVAGATFWLISLVSNDKHPILVLCVSVPLAIALLCLFIRKALRDLSQSRLTLDGDTLIVRGLITSSTFGMAFGASERRFQLEDIAMVTLGEKLNTFEKIVEALDTGGIVKSQTISGNRAIKEGRLLFTDTKGRIAMLHFADRVFDIEKLADFLAMLGRRGVKIEYTKV